jgi:hypothetical protein
MNTHQIKNHCKSKPGMTTEQAQWVAKNLYTYSVPDWSEMSLAQINQCLRDTLVFRPVETLAENLRVGDTVKPNHLNFRLIASIETKPDRIVVTDDLGLTHAFPRQSKVLTQLLQLA